MGGMDGSELTMRLRAAQSLELHGEPLDVSAPVEPSKKGLLLLGCWCNDVGRGDVRLELRGAAEDGRVDLPLPDSALDGKGT